MPLADPEARRQYQREYAARYRKTHAAQLYEHTKRWREKNWGRHLATAKRYRDKHPDRVHASMQRVDATRNAKPERNAARIAWKHSHPELMREVNAKARLKRKLAVAKNGGTCTPEQWIARCELYGWLCAYCLKALTAKTAEIEHVIPVAKRGTGWPANLVPACRSCNAKKHDKRILPLRLRKES